MYQISRTELLDEWEKDRNRVKELEAKLAGYERRSECGESKLDWIERGEQILELEAKLAAAEKKLEYWRVKARYWIEQLSRRPERSINGIAQHGAAKEK